MNNKYIRDKLRDFTKNAYHYRLLNFVNKALINVINKKG